MEVKEFINETVSQILDSVDELNAKYAEKGASIASLGDYNYKNVWRKNYVTDVDFDIALEVVSDKETSKGGQLGVASVVTGGIESTNKKLDQLVSRVHFTLPVMFPESK